MREIVTGVSHQPELTTDQAPERESPVRVRYLTGIEQDISYGELLDRFEGDHVETRRYLLGTDRAGRDLLSRLIFGTRISLSIGLAAVAISLFIGIVAGTLAGYFGRLTDTVIVWLISVIWSVPGIMLVIAISIALQSRGLWVIFLAVGLTMWVEVARTVRGEMLALREKQYVEAARAFGFSDFRIVFRHIMPNMAGTLVVLATANFASAILLEAGLSFLGLGVQPPTPSWGMMVYEGFQAMGTKNSWHLILFPALAICIMVLAFNLLGSGLRDATDPNTKGKY
jgi:peptide/nickel transport system permease protein